MPVGNGSGVGLGRYYGEESATNKEFMDFKTKEQEELKGGANCCGTSGDYANYYPPADSIGELNRLSSVGGGAPLTGGDLIVPRNI